jgi:CP family cyanate transporter-like MFS transporter
VGISGSARRSAAGWIAAVVLVSLNMRPVIASVPPIVDEVRTAYGLSAGAAGALTAAPVICMGLFAPAAGWVAARWSTGRAVAGALALLTVAAAVRPLGGPALLFAGTVAAGVSVAVGGALLPALVRARFPDRVGPMTGVYTTALIGGALIGAGLTEPLRSVLPGGWRGALAVWAVPAAAALAVWWVARPAARAPGPSAAPAGPATGPPPGRGRWSLPARGRWSPWRSRTAWLATAYMGGQSLLYYAALAWLSARYTELGWSVRAAAGLLALFSAAQLVTALGLPLLARRDPRPAIVGALVTTMASLALIALVPLAAPAVWATVLGLGVGGSFALALTVVGQVAPTPADTPRAAGMAFFVGYLLAAAGPVAVGLLHDVTGDYRWPYLALVGAGLATLAAAVPAGAATRPRAGVAG